jgi:protein TonB
MRIYIIFFFLTVISFQSKAQTPSFDGPISTGTEEPTDTSVFIFVGSMPLFNGGADTEFQNYIQKNLVYPKDAKEKGIQGTVYIQFIVETNGSVSNVRILRGLYPSCDQAAIDVVSKSPKWKPGENNGKPVRIKKTVKIIFQL